METRVPGWHRPDDARLVRVLHGAHVRLNSVPHEHPVFASPWCFPPRKRQLYPAVVEDLCLWAKDLSFFGTKVWRPIAVELDAVSEVDELELVQPAGVHLDVQAEKHAQRRVALDIHRGARAFDHGTGPCLRGGRRTKDSGEDANEEA